MDIADKCNILSELWNDYRHDEEFEDFIDYNDIGLPLASFISQELVAMTPRAEIFILETWSLLVAALEIEDKDYETLDAMFFESGKIQP